MKLAVFLGIVVAVLFGSSASGREPGVSVIDEEFKRTHLGFHMTFTLPIPFRVLPIRDTWQGTPPPSRPPIVLPTPELIVETAGNRVSGRASWFCKAGVSICTKGYPPGSMVAAAGPGLRAAICGSQSCESWRGRQVVVCSRTGCRSITLTDWCQCYWKQSGEKLIDLYYVVWQAIDPKDGVTVSW